MSKLFRLLASAIVLSALTLSGTGCASKDASCCDKPEKTCNLDGCRQSCPEARDVGGCTVADINTELVSLRKIVPSEASIGSPFTVEIHIQAKQNVANVMVTDTVPEEARFVQSEPGASVSGDKLSWRFDTMACGDCQKITYTLEPRGEGCLLGCVSVIAVPRACVSTFVGKAVLEIEKCCGCDVVEVGCPIDYTILVRNVGNTVARDVVVTDTLPDNVQHASGNKTLTFDIGCLRPCEAQEIQVNVCTSDRGRCQNVATATASNAEKVAATASCTCVQHVVDIMKDGPEKQFIGKIANYSIVVRNPGDSELTNLVVVDHAPQGSTICSAPGACVRGSQATWTLAQLGPGESKTLELGLCADCCGTLCNNVTVNTCEGVCDQAEICTEWVGHPALCIEVVDECDPLLEGESTCYRIVVCNQGTAVDRNLRLVAKFPAQLTPDAVFGYTRGSINGKTVTFDPIEELCPRESVEYTIQAKAVATGDGHMRVELSSDLLRTPVIEEESTQVY